MQRQSAIRTLFAGLSSASPAAIATLTAQHNGHQAFPPRALALGANACKCVRPRQPLPAGRLFPVPNLTPIRLPVTAPAPILGVLSAKPLPNGKPDYLRLAMQSFSIRQVVQNWQRPQESMVHQILPSGPEICFKAVSTSFDQSLLLEATLPQRIIATNALCA